MKHLVLVIFLSAAAVASADTIVLTGTNPANCEDGCASLSPDYCFDTCSPFNISIPQFDPSLGTLTSVTWTFTDYQQYYGGINDIGDPLIGDPFTWTTTEGDQSDLLGLDGSNSQFNSGVVLCACVQISMGGWWNMDTIQAAGTVPDDNPFIGTGTLNIPITPFASASFPTSSNGGVEAGIEFTEDYATLSVTETYTTPEPRGAVAALAIGFLALFSLKATAGQPQP